MFHLFLTKIAFKQCKTMLTTASTLQFPDFSKEFVLIDSSNFAVDSVLSQEPIEEHLL